MSMGIQSYLNITQKLAKTIMENPNQPDGLITTILKMPSHGYNENDIAIVLNHIIESCDFSISYECELYRAIELLLDTESHYMITDHDSILEGYVFKCPSVDTVYFFPVEVIDFKDTYEVNLETEVSKITPERYDALVKRNPYIVQYAKDRNGLT